MKRVRTMSTIARHALDHAEIVPSAIAIVGMSCRYPDANTPTELWENVLAQRQAFRRMPSERLRLDDYWDDDPVTPDRTYGTQAAVIEGFDFDRVKYRVAGSTYRTADPAHWLALDTAARALEDAGFANGDGLPHAETGVLLGNTLTGEWTRATTLRLRWAYVQRTLEATLAEQGWSQSDRSAFLAQVEKRYKAPFPEIGAESLAGGLSNTIAGRICNYFDLKGGGYTVDGACASSLLAVTTACSSLATGDLDVALAGGVDLSLDPFELVGFAKTGALTPDRMRVYDERSAGFLPGEGCGFIVLMRAEDALAEGRPIYATIRGWGVSSDGHGGITRPEADGQMLAVQRAYRRAGFGIETVGYFEGHGTGTAVGDTTELGMLSQAIRAAQGDRPAKLADFSVAADKQAVIGTVKANIGHTKAAAGMAGVIKATLALHTRTLPPTTGCERPHAELTAAGAPLRTLSQPEAWPWDGERRAGVSAMGFGGINTHIVLSQGTGTARAVNVSVAKLGASVQDAELFLWAAPTPSALRAQVGTLIELAPRLSLAELTDVAARLQRALSAATPAERGPRAAVVASTPEELTNALQTLAEWLDEPGWGDEFETSAQTQSRLDTKKGVFLGAFSVKSFGSAEQIEPPRIGFLFPGQGIPIYQDGGALGRRFTCARQLYEQADLRSNLQSSRQSNKTSSVHGTQFAQPAIVASSLAALRVMDRLNIQATVAVGHSLGELCALHWAGAFDECTLIRIARARGRFMDESGSRGGAMAQIGGTLDEIHTLVNGDPVAVACLNSPQRTVISGRSDAVDALVGRARQAGLHTTNLRVSHAFHSPLMGDAGERLAAYLAQEDFAPLQEPVVSTVTGTTLPPDHDLRQLLNEQVTAPVRFVQAVTEAAQRADLFVEVGPGRALSGLSAESVETPVLALDAGGLSLRGLLQVVGAAFALGAEVNHDALFANRFARDFNLDSPLRFWTNPCEMVPVVAEAVFEQHDPIEEKHLSQIHDLVASGSNGRANGHRNCAVAIENSIAEPIEAKALVARSDTTKLNAGDALVLVRQLVAERTELPLAAIGDEDRLLSDLHLNSITVSQIVVEAAQRLDLAAPVAPTEYANVTVSTVAATLEEMARTGNAATQENALHLAAGVDAWVRAYGIEWVDAPLVSLAGNQQNVSAESRWQVLGSQDDSFTLALRDAFVQAATTRAGVAVCLPPVVNQAVIPDLLRAVGLVLREGAACLLLVQQGGSAAALARTFHVEHPDIDTCVVTVPPEHPNAAEWVIDEANAARGYVEARYDASGRRQTPQLYLLPEPVESTGSEALPLGADDLLLVSGGGKGITAECALSLARASGARLLLLGRSSPETDDELAANLERMGAAGVTFRYAAVDVTDAAGVRAVVTRAEEEFGPVTGILHGAARNVPKLLDTLTEGDFGATLAPKLGGAETLLAAVEQNHLRLFVAFGSIIGRTGLPGEGDYAIANEWLATFTEQLQERLPTCRCLAIEWSVWAGAGMGDRLGTLETLTRQGIQPIPLDAGVGMLHRLLIQSQSPATPTTTVVMGRLGDLPTLPLPRPQLPLLRFLEQTQVYYPGVELVVDATLSADTDPYLSDHVFRGELLLPAVMGLEAMAQAAMALCGLDGQTVSEQPVFEQAELMHPVVVPQRGAVTIRVAALKRSAHEVEVVLRSQESGFQADHFRAIVRFEPPVDELSLPAGWARMDDSPLSAISSFSPEEDLYENLLFHHRRFRRVEHYCQIEAKSCVAQIQTRREKWYSAYLPPGLVLGDPGARDAVIHAIQVCVPHGTLLPVGVERLVPGIEPEGGPYRVHARQRSQQERTYVYDVVVTTLAGEIVESWAGLRLRQVEDSTFNGPWPVPLLAPYLERKWQDALSVADVRCVVLTQDVGQEDLRTRRQRSDRVIQQALGHAAPVFRRGDGKPDVAGEQCVSVTHTDGLTLAVAGKRQIGVDIEPVVHHTPAEWRTLLGVERMALAEMIVQTTGEPSAVAAIRVWSALESLKKAGVALNTPLTLTATPDKGWVLLSAGALRVATVCVQTHVTGESLVVALASGKTSAFEGQSLVNTLAVSLVNPEYDMQLAERSLHARL